MDESDRSRRSFLTASGSAVASAWLATHWPQIVAAAHHAHADAAGALPSGTPLAFLTASEAADVDAITAQIVPSDDTPGAREARVVRFIDRALSTFYADRAASYRRELAAFQAGVRDRHPAAASFAALSGPQQIEHLRSIEASAFFGVTRFLTLLGLFASPAYGGNHDRIGWALIGFRDEHVFQPPFGFYDRDYPGFMPHTSNDP